MTKELKLDDGFETKDPFRRALPVSIRVCSRMKCLRNPCFNVWIGAAFYQTRCLCTCDVCALDIIIYIKNAKKIVSRVAVESYAFLVGIKG